MLKSKPSCQELHIVHPPYLELKGKKKNKFEMSQSSISITVHLNRIISSNHKVPGNCILHQF